jgi:hypothetical protein
VQVFRTHVDPESKLQQSLFAEQPSWRSLTQRGPADEDDETDDVVEERLNELLNDVTDEADEGADELEVLGDCALLDCAELLEDVEELEDVLARENVDILMVDDGLLGAEVLEVVNQGETMICQAELPTTGEPIAEEGPGFSLPGRCVVDADTGAPECEFLPLPLPNPYPSFS